MRRARMSAAIPVLALLARLLVSGPSYGAGSPNLIISETATAEDDIQEVLAVLVRNAQADVLVVGKLRPSSHEPVVPSYKAVEVRDGTSLSGEYCREFRQTVTIGGRTRRAYGVACQRPGGGWRIARQ